MQASSFGRLLFYTFVLPLAGGSVIIVLVHEILPYDFLLSGVGIKQLSVLFNLRFAFREENFREFTP
jgi:hypothetical protein